MFSPITTNALARPHGGLGRGGVAPYISIVVDTQFVVLDSSGSGFNPTFTILDSDGNSFVVTDTILDSDGNSFQVN